MLAHFWPLMAPVPGCGFCSTRKWDAATLCALERRRKSGNKKRNREKDVHMNFEGKVLKDSDEVRACVFEDGARVNQKGRGGGVQAFQNKDRAGASQFGYIQHSTEKSHEGAGFPEQGPGWRVAVWIFSTAGKSHEGAGFPEQGPGWRVAVGIVSTAGESHEGAGFPEQGPDWRVAVGIVSTAGKSHEGAGFPEQGPDWRVAVGIVSTAGKIHEGGGFP